MKTFNWDLFKDKNNKIAVYCKTENEAKDFCRKMHEHGLRWSSGRSYLISTYWGTYKTNMCYGNHGTYGDYSSFIVSDYSILEWSNYMDEYQVETVEEFLMRIGRKIQSYE